MHYRVVCTDCERVVDQCRCPSKDKETRYVICDLCKEKALSKIKEKNFGKIPKKLY